MEVAEEIAHWDSFIGYIKWMDDAVARPYGFHRQCVMSQLRRNASLLAK